MDIIKVLSAKANAPPNPGQQITCEHKFAHLETTKTQAMDGGYCGINLDWKRIDHFFCEKCLEIVEKVKRAPADAPKPDWF